jgi:hypothetical protein
MFESQSYRYAKFTADDEVERLSRVIRILLSLTGITDRAEGITISEVHLDCIFRRSI